MLLIAASSASAFGQPPPRATASERASASLAEAEGEGGAALSLLDVPFLSQSELLCGGAAAAMVLRFNGERGVSADDFASIVDRSAGGISTSALARAIRDRGWDVHALDGTPDLVPGELARGRPIIALIEDRPGTLHYVVLVGWHERGVVLHDPARTPYRVMTAGEFARRWEVTRRWAVVISKAPGELAAKTRSREEDPGSPPLSPCDAVVREGVGLAQANDLSAAERLLADAAIRCPGAAARRELAGVRLLQRRWPEVAELSAEALRLDPADKHARRLFATSRFVQGDHAAALDAWNAIGEPLLDLVRIDGLIRTRHRIVERQMALTPGRVLTGSDLNRARRRLDELPAAMATRVDFVPVTGGRAEVRAAVAERPVFPSGKVSYALIGLQAGAAREVIAHVAGVSGGGERLTAAWRFWPHRPRYALALAAPAPFGATWRVEGSAERQPFTSALPPSERASGHVSIADWGSSSVRWEARTGLDRWKGVGRFAHVGADLRLELSGAHATVRPGVQAWMGDAAFSTVSILADWRSSPARRGRVVTASGGVASVQGSPPLTIWPGADTGHTRPLLLRAHPLIDEGRLRDDRVGRRVAGGSLEGQLWRRPAGPVAMGAAAFVDAARTMQRRAGRALTDFDVGGGLRFAIAGAPGVFRVDLAHGLRDGHNAMSIVWDREP
jgi:hypothetical protein